MSGSNESQAGFLSRRRFFRWASSLTAALGAAPLVSSAEAISSPAASSDGEDYYAKLGVPTIINAAGTYTTLTAACMPPEVLAAVQKAALHPVRLHELQRKAGEYIAQRRQIGQLSAQQQALTAQLGRLHAQERQLSDPAYVEQIARDELHLCMPRQTCYVIIDGKPAAGLIQPHTAPPSPWYDRLWQSVREADETGKAGKKTTR